jgi:hypothetical protein
MTFASGSVTNILLAIITIVSLIILLYVSRIASK